MKKGKERPSTSVAPPPSNAKKVEKKGQLGAAVLASVIAATPVHRVPPMEDTEGLVLDTIDWILDETFLFQIQYERLEKQMHFGIEAMVSSIISTLRMGCYIDYDVVVSVECCEDEPRADSVDRHAVQALPKKEVSAHPQRLYESPNGVPFQRAISLRSMSEKSSLPPRNTASSAAPQPRRETKAWRIKCMTELTSSKQKKAKWGKVSVLRRALGQREYDVTETTVVCDATTIGDGDNDPDAVTIDSAPVTTLDTVRTIPDDTPVDQDTSLLLLHQPSPKEDTPEKVPPADDKPPRARRRHGAAEVKTPKRTVKSSWFYEKLSVKGEFKQEKAYEPHVMELQRETFAQSIELNTGVSLVQGVSKYLGPNRRETMSAMSRQGFQVEITANTRSSPSLNAPNNDKYASTPSRVKKLKYIREFPSPKAEVVTVLKAPDDRHRMAWLT
ncbi:hypothetical protein DYB38_000128 [Aphanomyces astaci]|uniref:Uncharacterized protein n=1 Tax=Aphanomyces astaci TaxID=112090 RepID=A0A397CGE5_APHAT|nr:hypothetical protein DYB38_000128 [Aphanomyces astaci]